MKMLINKGIAILFLLGLPIAAQAENLTVQNR